MRGLFWEELWPGVGFRKLDLVVLGGEVGDGVRGPGVRYDATARQESHLLLFKFITVLLDRLGTEVCHA